MKKLEKLKNKALYPIHVNKNTWFYIEKGAITFCREIFKDNQYITTSVFKIGYKKLLKSIKLAKKVKYFKVKNVKKSK